jgi:hypothetical protein
MSYQLVQVERLKRESGMASEEALTALRANDFNHEKAL